MKEIEQKISAIIKQNDDMKKQFDLACSVPGVGTQTATYLIITPNHSPLFPTGENLLVIQVLLPLNIHQAAASRTNQSK